MVMDEKRLLLIALVGVLISPLGNSFEGDPEELTDEARKWVSQVTGLSASSINVSKLSKTSPLKRCAKELNFSFPFATTQRTVEVSCQVPKWKRYLRVKYSTLKMRLATSEDLIKGTKLESFHLMAIDSGSEHGGFEDSNDLIGTILKRDIPKSTIIKKDMISTPSVVYVPSRDYEAGETVRLIDLLIETVPKNSKKFLNSWPSGNVIAVTPLPAGHPISGTQIEISKRVVVAVNTILVGQVIDKTMIAEQFRPNNRVGEAFITTTDEVLGLEATRTIRVGTILGRNDITPAQLVRKGEEVKLTIKKGAMKVIVDTKAMGNGRLGDQVPLLNRESGRIIQGIVSGRFEAIGM